MKLTITVLQILVLGTIALLVIGMFTGCVTKPQLMKNCQTTSVSEVYICERF